MHEHVLHDAVDRHHARRRPDTPVIMPDEQDDRGERHGADHGAARRQVFGMNMP